MKKYRLDYFLSENNFSSSLEQAQKEIITGWVKVDGETVYNSQKKISGQEKIIIKRPKGRFVSRGGEKLDYSLKKFKIDLKGKVAVDIGASTGGFTDCLLKAGAKKVYSIDVGYGQFDYSLRNDARVILQERTNIRDVSSDFFKDKVDFLGIDLSFVSIVDIFKNIKQIFIPFFPLEGVILVKPQFEANPEEQVKGVVSEVENHKKILDRVLKGLFFQGLTLKNISLSPLKGPAGNIEFLLYFALGEIRQESTLNR